MPSSKACSSSISSTKTEDVTVNIEQVRPGLYCVHCDWRGPEWHFGEDYPTPTRADVVSEYNTNFSINTQPYTFKIKFKKYKTISKASLRLIQVNESTSPITRTEGERGGKTTRTIGEEALGYRPADHQFACSVWANLSGGEKISHMLKPVITYNDSWASDREWISEKIDGYFIWPAFTNGYSIVMKPLTCLLWIEFETISTTERNALKHLTNFHTQQEFCDVIFKFGGGRHVGAHISILAARSPVFAAMFRHRMRESITHEVNIEDIDLDIFNQLLYYIYSGRISMPLLEENVYSLFSAADMYAIDDLKKDCLEYLLDNVRLDNAIRLIVWAHNHDLKNFEKMILTFIASHGAEICMQKDWEELTKNYPELCLMVTRRIVTQMGPTSGEKTSICN